MKSAEHYDLAAVGGGIAGLYCCLHAPAGMKVALFEATDRVGGKIETVPMEGFQAEYGAMRFDPVHQPMVGELLGDLHLETGPFPEYNSPPVRERRTKCDLAAEEKDLNAPELFTRALSHAVLRLPLLKCFFVVKDPWWHEDIPNRGIGDFPARELHYYRQADRGNVMVYADRPCLNFWGRHVQAGCHDRAQINREPELPRAFARRMKIDPATILAYGIRDWGRAPYGGARASVATGFRALERQ